jgi:hypothetical protein
MLQNSLMSQLIVHHNMFIFLRDRASPHFNRSVRVFLNATLLNRWIGKAGAADEKNEVASLFSGPTSI